MKILKTASIVIFLLVIGCKKYKYPTMETTQMSAEAMEGERLYMHYCQTCHPDGEAGLGPSVYYLPSFMRRFQVRHGLGVMPRFKEEVISDEELKKINLYLKALDKSN